MVAGLEYDKEALKEFYSKLSEDIKRQKSRIGGDWVIANVAFSRDIRDAIRFNLSQFILGQSKYFYFQTCFRGGITIHWTNFK